MSCESHDVKYVDDLPYKERKELCRLLDQDDDWEELGTHMEFTYEEVEEFRCRGERGDSATNCLLKAWEKENHTVLELCYFLKTMQHIKALKAIKSCIPSKYCDAFLNDGSCMITNILQSQQSSGGIISLTPRATMPSDHTSAQHQTDVNHSGPQSPTTMNGATGHHPSVTLDNSKEQRSHNIQDQKETASTLSSSKVPSTLLRPVHSTPQSGVVGGAVGGAREEVGKVTGPTVERELSRVRIDEGAAGSISNSEGSRRVAEGPPFKPGASAIPKSVVPKSILPNSARPYSVVPNSVIPNVVPKSPYAPSSSVSPNTSQPVSNSSLNGPIFQPVAKSSSPSSISTSLSQSVSNASSSGLISLSLSQPSAKSSSPSSISPSVSQPNAKSSSPSSISPSVSQPNAKSSSPSSISPSLSQPSAKSSSLSSISPSLSQPNAISSSPSSISPSLSQPNAISSSPSSISPSLSQSVCKPSPFAPAPPSVSSGAGYFIAQPPTAANKTFMLPSSSEDEDEP